MGGLRPILDLHHLNTFNALIHATEVQDALFEQVVSQTRSEDWLVTIELKDTFSHLRPSPSQGVPEVFFLGQSLPTPGSFFRPCTLTPHFHKVRNHIDDWLILAQSYSERMAVWH